MKYKKSVLLITIICACTTYSFTQITFEPGYFITNEGQKVECLIKNIDWKNNPRGFYYKLSEEGETKEHTIKMVNEFAVIDKRKYIKSEVKIDRNSTSNNLSDLDTKRNPVFQTETLFLEVLVEGKKNLYKYEDRNMVRFFYTDHSGEIEQLMYKIYEVVKDGKSYVTENRIYQQQLINDLKCPDISAQYIKDLPYKEKPLVKLFNKYSVCQNLEPRIYQEKYDRKLFNFHLKAGINYSSTDLKIYHYSSFTGDATSVDIIDFGNKISYRLGVGLEFILPFNKNTWSVVLEPTFRTYKGEVKESINKYSIKYNSIEVPLGIKYHLYLSNNSKLFFTALFDVDFALSSYVKLGYDEEKVYAVGKENIIHINYSSSASLGIGYTFIDKYSVELRTNLNRRHLIREASSPLAYNKYLMYHSSFLMFGYKF